MNKEKRIEEMAKLIHLNYDMPLEFTEGLAEFLIDEGYRKASEIFEEIESLLGKNTIWLCCTPWKYNDYEKLKKKYGVSEKE